MNNLETRFAISTRFIAWGNELDHRRLCFQMGLDNSAVRIEKRGEQFRSSSSSRIRTAKTGLVSVTFDDEFNTFDPATQLSSAGTTLSRLSRDTLQSCRVDRSELQVFTYYEKVNPNVAEPDFSVPDLLLAALVNAGIQLSITVMP